MERKIAEREREKKKTTKEKKHTAKIPGKKCWRMTPKSRKDGESDFCKMKEGIEKPRR